MHHPLLSIITVTYNLIENKRTEKFIRNIESVKNNMYKHIEHIVIDGDSNDGTKLILEKYKNLNYFKYISEPDCGPYHAMNKGIELCTGDYILILNSDDYLTKNGLNNIFTSNEFDWQDAILGDIYHSNDDTGLPQEINPVAFDDSCLINTCHFHPATLYSKKVHSKIGVYDLSYKYASDFHLFCRFYRKNFSALVSKEKISVHTAGGLSFGNNKESIDNILSERFKIIKENFPSIEDKYIHMLKSVRYNTYNNIVKLMKKLPQDKKLQKSIACLARLKYYSEKKPTNKFFASSFLLFLKSFQRKNVHKKIDLVYLWCNHNDKEWMRKKMFYEQKINPERIFDTKYDNHDELLYSLRSVEKYAPWINHIFIVTDGQRPSWLRDSSNVTIIDHKDILDDCFLPTFNSVAIEAAIYKIPGLSEFYLLANDDTFFAKKTAQSFFFNDKPVYRFCKDFTFTNNLHSKSVLYTYNTITKKINDYLPVYHSSHNIDPYIKTDVINFYKLFTTETYNTYKNRFRSDSDIHRTGIHAYTTYINKSTSTILPEINSDFICFWDFRKLSIEQLKKHTCNLFCINDPGNTTKEDTENLKFKLNCLYPTPSSFEKTQYKVFNIFKHSNNIAVYIHNIQLYSRIVESNTTTTSILNRLFYTTKKNGKRKFFLCSFRIF